jgi:DNA-binding transcriptional LysR family regulator
VDLDTAALRALVVLAEELHFGRAAGRLGITQQALSKRIQRLEAELTAPLIDRTDRRAIGITHAGQRVLPIAHQVLAAIDRLDAHLEHPEGRIRVDVMGDYLAPTRWLRHAAQATTLPLDAVERPANETAEHLLLNRRAHLAFGRAGAVPSPWPPRVHRRLVLLEPLAILAPASHPWAALDELPLADLGGQRLWFPMAAAPVEWRSYVAEFSAAADVTVDTTGSTFGYRQWAEDVTAGLAPPSLIGEAMTPPDPRMRTIPIVEPTPVYPWSLLWRDDLPASTVDTLLAAAGFAAPPPLLRPGTWLPATDAALLDAPAPIPGS